jgi:diaminopimelate epimerase
VPFVRIIKAHAYGNDFLLAPAGSVSGDPQAFARRACDRHRGIGADGLILYTKAAAAATMVLFNADGSRSELSGNGLRCLAAHVAREDGLDAGTTIHVETGAGPKVLDLLDVRGSSYRFRAALGPPEHLRRVDIMVGDDRIEATAMTLGNPQLIVLGPLPDRGQFERLGAALAAHPAFPEGTNVEFASVEAPGRVRILIWERGVGPTTSSGTGTSASAVAAAAHGGAAREVDVIAPGGTQRVEWGEDNVYLTGWAELLLDGSWLGAG